VTFVDEHKKLFGVEPICMVLTGLPQLTGTRRWQSVG